MDHSWLAEAPLAGPKPCSSALGHGVHGLTGKGTRSIGRRAVERGKESKECRVAKLETEELKEKDTRKRK